MPVESKAKLKERAGRIIEVLGRRYPDADCALNWRNPLQLLVATILSAQCTDARVNIITKDLFRKYRTVDDFADVPQEDLQEEIRSAGFFRNKAKSIRGAAATIREKFGGKVPQAMDDLLSLPGVARKTANVVLGTAFGRNDGLVVDTHVMRLAQRMKLTRRKNNQADRIEKDLMHLVPREEWTHFAHAMTWHGRRICTARKPDCDHCPVNELCPSAGKI